MRGKNVVTWDIAFSEIRQVTFRKIGDRDARHCHFLKSTYDIGDSPSHHQGPHPRRARHHTALTVHSGAAHHALTIPRRPPPAAANKLPSARGYGDRVACIPMRSSRSEQVPEGGELLGRPALRPRRGGRGVY